MGAEEITTIVTRLDKVDSKLDRLSEHLDNLAIRYERHEAQAEQRDMSAAEMRRFLTAVAAGVTVAALSAFGGLTLAIIKAVS